MATICCTQCQVNINRLPPVEVTINIAVCFRYIRFCKHRKVKIYASFLLLNRMITNTPIKNTPKKIGQFESGTEVTP